VALLFSLEWWSLIRYGVYGSPAVCCWREPIISRVLDHNRRPVVPEIFYPNTTHPLKSSAPSLKAQSTQPSAISPKSSYTNQPTICPPPPQAPVKTMEEQVQPKPTEVPRTNHPRGHLHRYKSTKETSSLSKFNCKTGKRKPL
jgi:hypothetical protein